MRSEARPAAPDPALRRFRITLIKPSHYDDNGYVVRAFRSSMPANSLATVYALVMDGANRQVLGPDTAIDLTAIDETNT
ncbi:MAG TPA: radical SAM protein, partial [Xanthobacteraceae bacterium]|nr:radical SAM protein [Xanthobacteraceae bacterium]